MRSEPNFGWSGRETAHDELTLATKLLVSIKKPLMMRGFAAAHARDVGLVRIDGRHCPRSREFRSRAVDRVFTHLWSKSSRRIAYGKACRRRHRRQNEDFQADTKTNEILIACDRHNPVHFIPKPLLFWLSLHCGDSPNDSYRRHTTYLPLPQRDNR